MRVVIIICVWLLAGSCVATGTTCGDGTIDQDGTCVPSGDGGVSGVNCGAGTHQVGVDCIADGSAISCGMGTHEEASTCVPDSGGLTCGAGTHAAGGQCIADTASDAGSLSCGEGTHLSGSLCAPGAAGCIATGKGTLDAPFVADEPAGCASMTWRFAHGPGATAYFSVQATQGQTVIVTMDCVSSGGSCGGPQDCVDAASLPLQGTLPACTDLSLGIRAARESGVCPAMQFTASSAGTFLVRIKNTYGCDQTVSASFSHTGP